jgi:hypothetical protein
MAKNRKAAEDYILKYINKLLPDKSNESLYVNLFKSMSDKDFDVFMKKVETGEIKLAVVDPNFNATGLSVERNFKIAEEFKFEFFKHLWISGSNSTEPTYLSVIPYLVMDMPIRRVSQLLTKKMSIPENNNIVDNLTGQPTGASKGARISFPELQVLAAIGMDSSLTEFMKYRGGDRRGLMAMNNTISKTGHVTLADMDKYQSGVESTKTLNVYLTGCHLQNTL